MKQKSYIEAREEMEKLFASLSLPVEVSSPIGEVKDGWPCISFKITIKGEIFNYSLGIGHVDWKKAERQISIILPYEERFSLSADVIEKQSRGKIIPETYNLLVANIAAKIANQQKVSPSPAQVLVCICGDGIEAERAKNYEEWAANFGYDEDSYKGRKTYEACLDGARQARRIVKHEIMEKLAELSSQI